jgi:hypothetical protein
MDAALPIRNLVKVLCWWQVACPALLLVTTVAFLSFGVHVDASNPVADLWAFCLIWAWLAGTPLFAVAALLLDRTAGWRPARPINIAALLLWMAGVIVAFFMPLG